MTCEDFIVDPFNIQIPGVLYPLRLSVPGQDNFSFGQELIPYQPTLAIVTSKWLYNIGIE